MNQVTIIPYNYSKYGVYTSFFVLLNAVVAFIYGHLILSVFLSCLYVTSVMNWKNMTLISPAKTADIFFACTCIMYITLVTAPSFTDFWYDMWLDYVVFATVIFTFNTAIFYEELNNAYDFVVSDQVLTLHVTTHLVVMHILSTMVCMAGIISLKQKQ